MEKLRAAIDSGGDSNPSPGKTIPRAARRARVDAPAPAKAVAAPAPGRDLRKLMLQVVADKTGYPADMLRLDMALESDLGIDSIKRVEILSALREQLPTLPDLPPSALGDLRTLADITALLSEKPAAPPPATAALGRFT